MGTRMKKVRPMKNRRWLETSAKCWEKPRDWQQQLKSLWQWPDENDFGLECHWTRSSMTAHCMRRTNELRISEVATAASRKVRSRMLASL